MIINLEALDNKLLNFQYKLFIMRQNLAEKKKLKSDNFNFIEQAKILEKQSKFDEAISTYQRAIEFYPKRASWIYQRLGALLRKQGKLDDSIAFYKKANELNPNDGDLYRGLGVSYSEKGDIEIAVASYQKSIELNSEQPSWVYKELGDCLIQQNKLEKALSAYQKLIELKPDKPERLYIKMGDACSQQNEWEKAVRFYQKALSIDPYLGEKIHLAMRHAKLQQGQIEDANISYQNALKRRYLIDYKHKIVYCPIPKNACTLFKTIIIEHSHDREQYEQSKQNIHAYTYRNNKGVSLKDFAYLNNPDYFKFVILRNPFNRLVSAYIEKFAKRRKPPSFVQDVIKDVHKFLSMESDIHKSITFSQFVHYLLRTEDNYLNAHWRPQHTFLGEGLFKFDFVGQFERLDSIITYLEQKLSIKIETSTSKHMTDYCVFGDQEKFHDRYPADLRSLNAFPQVHHFYTAELEELVRKKYAEDIRIYEKEFNVTLPGF